MDKARRSVSIDETIDEEIRDQDVEFSPLVNKWAEDYFVEKRRPLMDEQRVDEMLDELDRREADLDAAVADIKATFDDIRGELQRATGGDGVTEADVEDVYNELTDWVPKARPTNYGPDYEQKGTPRDPQNPAIQHNAKRLGMSPTDLVDELRQRDRRDGFLGGDSE